MKTNSGNLIGIDLGGTNVRAAAITPEGEFLTWQETPIEAARGPKAGLQTVSALLDHVIAATGQPAAAIGIGAPGPLDRDRGSIQNPYTLPGWENVDIVNPLQTRYHVPVALENDADAAALGEAWTGAGKTLRSMTMVTFGTGVGTGTILNGQILRGLGGEHPEGGHIILDPSGPPCYCGAHGCWESLASGTAIARIARQSKEVHSSSLMAACGGDLEKLDAGMIFSAARQGDAFSMQMVNQTAEYIGLGFVTVMMLILPEGIIFTGGVMRSFDLMENRIREVIARHDIVIPAGKVQLLPAALGQKAGVFGAARAGQLLANSKA